MQFRTRNIQSLEKHEAIAPEIANWIKIAKADVVARNSTELLRVMENRAVKTPSERNTKYFRFTKFEPGMEAASYKGNTIVTTNSDVGYEYASSKFEDEMRIRPTTLTILRLDKEKLTLEQEQSLITDLTDVEKTHLVIETSAPQSKKLQEK